MVMVVVALAGGLAAAMLPRHSKSQSSTTVAARPVAVVQVKVDHITKDLRVLGTVSPLNVVAVQAQIDGQISAVMFSEGQRVVAGDKLFRIDPRLYEAELNRALAGVEKDQADLQAATLLMHRLVDLNNRDPGFTPKKDLDAQQALVASLAGALHQSQAQLESARVKLEYATIRAPIAGRVGKRLIDVGNVLRAADGTKLTSITQMDPIDVDFSVPQEYLPAIRALEGTGPVRVELRASQTDRVLGTGKVVFLGDSIDQKSGSILMRAQFDNKDERLWPGQFVDVRVTLADLSDQIVIPQQAIRAAAMGPAVFVVNPESEVELRPVTIGLRSDGRVSISKGLSPGETVVVEGVDGLSAHMHVSTVAYMDQAQ